ncbi:hypothetical protein [Planococcus lenghuensis]|nr:hypothetical protein [Planococcus lenghuensis]
MTFLITGLIVMWLIILLYIAQMTKEQRKVNKQLANIQKHSD